MMPNCGVFTNRPGVPIFGWLRGLRPAGHLASRENDGSDQGRYLLLPLPIRLPPLKDRYHFLLAQAEAGVPRISPVTSHGAPIKPVQLITSQGIVMARYTSK